MIHLVRPPVPTELTAELVAELTERFKTTGASVWLRTSITRPLLNSSHNKCAYCEASLEPVQGMEVEHFVSKSQDPERVIQWENLLPSCGTCNGRKFTHDVLAEPIINPFDQNPKEHLALKMIRFVGTTDLGRMTLEVLPLARLNGERFKVVSALLTKVENLLGELQVEELPVETEKRRNLQRKARAILRSGTAVKAYSATSAGVLVHDFHQEWQQCVLLLKRLSVWTDEMQDLWQEVQEAALPYFVSPVEAVPEP